MFSKKIVWMVAVVTFLGSAIARAQDNGALL